VIFGDRINLNNETESDHFENIQSTNWQTMRFKPPPPGSPIGWRVEFRPMEVQFSDFENAAYTVFIVLVTRVIISYRCNFYLPLSLVDENLQRAHQRDAVHRSKFWWRQDGRDKEELSLDEIINGKLIPLVRAYLSCITVDLRTTLLIDRYLELISKRASGEWPTNAAWIRRFIAEHPHYAKDSLVTDEICTDLLRTIADMGSKRSGFGEFYDHSSSNSSKI
jgi:glutamate--cysteine ligase catalytic subunit